MSQELEVRFIIRVKKKIYILYNIMKPKKNSKPQKKFYPYKRNCYALSLLRRAYFKIH